MDQLWRRVGNIFEDLYRQVDAVMPEDAFSSPFFDTGTPLPAPFISLCLPQEDAVIKQLVESGASKGHAAELCWIHCDRASDLASRYQTLYNDTYRDITLAGRPSSSTHVAKLATKLQGSYEKTLSRWMDDMTNSVGALKQNAEKSKAAGKKRRTTVFNQEFSPFLEVFFERNQFPSRTDKILLAKKSSMTFRQIHVWFQNRRTRCKKGRKSCDIIQPEKTALASDDCQVDSLSKHLIDAADDEATTELDEASDDVKTINSSRCSSITLVEDENPFDHEPPPFAFPAVYPPEGDDDPFPCRFGKFSFAKPTWPRSPPLQTASEKSKTTSTPDVSEVIEALERLSIKESESNCDGRGCDILAPITTRPLPAPLPSLVRRIASAFQPVTMRSRPLDSTLSRHVYGCSGLPSASGSDRASSPRGCTRRAPPESLHIPVSGDGTSLECVAQKTVPLPKRNLRGDRKKPQSRTSTSHTAAAQTGGTTWVDTPNLYSFPERSVHELYLSPDQLAAPSSEFSLPVIASVDNLFDSVYSSELFVSTPLIGPFIGS